MRRIVFTVTFLAALVSPTAAQHALGGTGPYDPSIPTPASVLGYELGDRFTPHHLIVRYYEAVANASPRVMLDTVAVTYEGRELLLATVTSEANMRRIDEIRENARRLGDPRGASDAELNSAILRTPAIVWLGYSVHGNEASGVEAGLATLYELAASQSPEMQTLLDSTVVLIDPVQNPDGHERHVQDVMRDRGAFGPDPYPSSMTNEGTWPGARTSHYLFDLNRDWFIHSHPESRGRTSVFHEWYPHVAVDLHEMGSSSTYFFAPPMEPVNKNVPQQVHDWWDIFARGNAEAFAAHGWGFFTREGYDEFWPGYGVSWPTLTGAIGMTYEQASSNGGAIRRPDGSVLTLREAASHHYTASIATVRTAATRRTDRVRDYLAFRREAITDHARGPLRTILLERDAQGRADSLVALLRSNAIEVSQLTEERRIGATAYGETAGRSVTFPVGTYVVDLAQPQGRLAKAILEPDAELDSTFIREELANREVGIGDRFYDVTAWSLPLTHRVRAWHTDAVVGWIEPATFGPAGVQPPARAGYAYAFEPGSQRALRMLAGLLADSVRVRHSPNWFRVGRDAFPHGAFVVLVNRNGPDLHEKVAALARETGTRVVAIDNALVDAGTDLGSNSVESLPIPRVALVGGEGTSAYSYGAAWYVFDQQLRFPVTRVQLSDLAGVLDDFNVIVIPSAFGIGGRLGDNGTEALQRWVRNGGVLITLDGATSWLASEQSGLSRLRPKEGPEPDSTGRAPLPSSVPGAILRAAADTLSPLMAGVNASELAVMYGGGGAYALPDGYRPGEAVIRYVDDLDRLRISGYLWPEAPARVAGTPFLWTERAGRGRVIGFTDDPNFRTLWRGLLPIFANAVFLGGSF